MEGPRIKRASLIAIVAMLASLLPLVAAGASGHEPGLTPDEVVETVAVGGQFDVAKTVHTPEIPPSVDVCLLEDETGSFSDDIGNLKNPVTIAAIYDGVTAVAADANFAVAGFRDYAQSPHGGGGDWVYRLTSSMSPAFAAWEAGVNALSAGGGADTPEAQYDAIVAAVGPGPTDFEPDPLGPQDDCGWRDDDTVTRVLVVTTDAPFHLPGAGKPHVNDGASTLAALDAQGVVVIGLKAPGAGGELNALAAATGGSVQPLSSSGANIAQAILDGLAAIEIDVSMTSNCEPPVGTAFDPLVQTVTSGDDALFTETISLAADAVPGTYECQDWALIDGSAMTNAAGEIIYEEKSITAAAAFCEEGVNAAGKTPKAPGTGQNEDGFFLIGADDGSDGLAVTLIDDGSGTVFGPFPAGTNIKYTQNDDEVSIMPGPGAVDYKIKGYGDATVVFTDAFGNTSTASCLVPQPPK